MDAWGKWTNVSDKLIMAADGNGDFVKATGLVQGKSPPPSSFKITNNKQCPKETASASNVTMAFQNTPPPPLIIFATFVLR